MIANALAENQDSSLYLKKTISGSISPKSVVHNGNGVFFAQNMMYRHTITVYDRTYEKIATIKDGVNPAEFGFDRFDFKVKGGPVECAFSHNGKYAWVSNYSISGGDSTFFVNPGCDNCSGTGKYDSSFLYKINVGTQEIESVIQVGAVPKYVATSPDDKWVLVTNWSSGDLSVVDIHENKEFKRIKLGTFPRGIVIDGESKYAYITVMGSTKLARLSLSDFTIDFIDDVGKGPRHLCISPDNNWLYLTLNTENKIAKINLDTWEITRLNVGHQPRSMTISGDGRFLYLVNYNDNSFYKVNTSNFKILAASKTKSHPIGITYDDYKKEVWVACYSGYIQVFKDSLIASDLEIASEDDPQTDQLSFSKDGVASIAHLGNEISVDEIDSVMIDTEDELADNEMPLTRAMLPIRRLYLDFSKTFDFSEKPKETIDAEKVTDQQSVNISKTLELDEHKSYLVIVGSFGEYNNALNMVGIMADKGLQADHFKHPVKGLNYVFVYASDDLSEAKQWANSNMPDEVEYWVMNQ